MNSSEVLTVLPVAAAAFFVWHCLARVRPPGISHLVPRLPTKVQHFLSCPWCAGSWLCLAATLVAVLPHSTATPTPVIVVLTWLAASTLVGLTGSLLPDDGSETL